MSGLFRDRHSFNFLCFLFILFKERKISISNEKMGDLFQDK